MNKRFSAVKKLCSLLLCALMISGSVSVAGAAQDGQPETTVTGSVSTPDEAVETKEQPDEEEKPFEANKKELVKDSENVTYVSAKGLTSLTLRADLTAEQSEKISADLAAENTERLAVKLSREGDEEPSTLTAFCAFSVKNSRLTVVLDLSKAYPDGMGAGKTTLTVEYTPEGAEQADKLAEKKFTLVASAPVISDITYNEKSQAEWTNRPVKVAFKASSLSPITVMLDEEVISATDGVYSFTTEKNGPYTATAKDIFGAVTTQELKPKCDMGAPEVKSVSLTDKDGKDVSGSWTNKDITVAAQITDSLTNIDKKSITLNGNPVDESMLSGNGSDIVLTFAADAVKDYAICFKDAVGNVGTKTIEAKELLLDKESPEASDVTLSFTVEEDDIDKALSFLAFGIYRKKSLKVAVQAEEKGGSEQTVELYNDSSKLKADENGAYTLSADKALDSTSFDPKVVISDEAGNSVSYRLKNDNIKTRLSKGAQGLLANNEPVSDLIISKLAPTIDTENVVFEGFNSTYKTEKGYPFVSGDSGTIKINISEEITGIGHITVSFDNDKNVVEEKNLTDQNVTSYTYEMKVEGLKPGMHQVFVSAQSNSRNDSNAFVMFTVDNSPPSIKKESPFQYSNESAQPPDWKSRMDWWTKERVMVQFALADTAGVATVTCKSPSKIDVPVDRDNNTFTFVAEEYGNYEITAVDNLGNTSTFHTATIQIDNVPPTVEDNKFTFENNADTVWTSQPVKVSFQVKDMNEKQCVGLGNDAIKVYENGSEVTGAAIDLETNTCSFTAEKYAHYTYELTDKLGNSVKGDVGAPDTKVLIDQAAPVVKKVVFSKNGKSYGTYSNEDLAMTVTVENSKDGSGACAPLDDSSVSVFNKDGKPAKNISFVKRTPVDGSSDSEEFEFKITPAEAGALTAADLNLILEAKDAANNAEKFYLIKDAGIVKLVDGEGMTQGVYDVLATIATADIKPIETSGFDKSVPVNDPGSAFSGVVYNGKTLELKSTVTDTLAGLDEIKVEYAKIKANETDIDYQKLALDHNVTAEAVTGLDNSVKDSEASVSYQLNTEESGRYVFRITAKNNAGNECYSYVDFGVDNTKPVLKEAEVKGNIGKIGEKAIYMGKGDNTITVTVSDAENDAISSGIKSIELSNYGDDPLERIGEITAKDGVYQAVFRLADNKAYKNLLVTVTDAFDYQIKEIKITEIKVNNETVSAKRGFELVVSTDAENHFEASNVVYKNFIYSDDANKIYKPIGEEKLVMSFKNEFAGVNGVTVEIDGKEIDATLYTVQFNPTDAAKHTTATVTLDFANIDLSHGEHTISFIARDNGGTLSPAADEAFAVDSQSPAVKAISVQPHQESEGEKLFNLLTFGLFANSDIEAVVQIEDSYPSSGVRDEDVTLTFRGTELTEGVFETVSDDPSQSRIVKKTFVLPAGTDETDSFYNDLKVKVKDVFDNGDDKPVAPEKVDVNGKQVTPGDDFDITVNPQAPTIQFNAYTVNDNKNRSEDWFSENPVVHFTVSDEISRIHSVQVELNGKTVTEHCTYGDTDEPLPDQFTTFNDETEDTDVTEAKIALNTAGIELNQGENTVRVSATGNNGMTQTPVEWVFHMDYTAPVIKSIRFESTASPAEQWLNFVTFGLYSNNDIKATVTATEEESGMAADGIVLRSETGAVEVQNESFAVDGSTYTKSFILKMGSELADSFFNDLIIEVKNKVSVGKAVPYYEVEGLDADGNKIIVDKNYDVFSNNNKNNSNVWFHDYLPKDGSTRYSDGSKQWFSENPKVSFDVGDIYAKIHAVKVTLNDVDVTGNCVYNDGGLPDTDAFNMETAQKLPASFTTFNDDEKDTKVEAICVLLDTAGLELKEGANVIRVIPVGNNGVEREPAQSVFYMDTKAPTPELITYERTTGAEDQWLNFVTFGLYSNESIKATVTVSDGEHSAGISRDGIVLTTSNGGSISVDDSTPFCYENGKYSKSFILRLGSDDKDSFFNALSVVVTDRVSNSQTVDYNNIQNRSLDGKEMKVGEDFEVMSNSDAPSITFKGFEENGEHTYYVDEAQQDWFAVEPKMHFHVEDHMSKIHSVEILVDSKPARDYCTYTDENQYEVELPVEFTKFNEDVDTNKRIESLDVTLNMDGMGLTEGQHKVSYTATGNNGMQQTVQTKYFWIETEPPVVESIVFEKSIVDQVLNLLTFGLYSNDNIKATVEVSDGEHSSGIKNENFTMTSGTGTVVSQDDTFSFENGKWTKTFTLQVGKDENYSFNDLRFSVTDNVSNNVSGYYKTIPTKTANGEPMNVTDKFELVASNAAPQITTLVATPKDNTFVYPDNGKGDESGRFFSDYPDISAELHDSVSKIQSVTVNVNDKDVTDSAVLTNKTGGKSDNLPSTGVFTRPENKGQGAPDIYVSDMGTTLDTKTVAKSVNEGLNTVNITALGNNGQTKEEKITFIRDTTNPVITRFDFSGTGYQRFPDGYTPEKSNIIIEYYYFFQLETRLTVTASDGANGSGINEIRLLATPYESTTERDVTEEFHGHVNSDNPNQYIFTIPANNKLRLRAYAIDNVNNNANMADTYAPGNQVVETREMFEQSTGASFTYQPNSYTDNKNQRLYATETSINFMAWSTYAGIKQVDYKVIAPIGSGTKILNQGTIEVNNDGGVSDSSVLASVKRDHDAFNNQLNIVQSFTKTVHFSRDYNYNGMYLEVTITDYAGYVSKTFVSDRISVDTVEPKIVSIVFDNNNPNDLLGKHYYKEKRTATITIRERNFNPDAAHLNLVISPNTRTLVPGTNWNTTYNAEVENADNIEHVATVTFDTDAEYSMSLGFTDLAGNFSGTAKVDDFVIDLTDPVIREVSWSAAAMGKDGYYREARTATLTIVERNFYAGYVSITPSAVEGNDFVTPNVSWYSGDGDTHIATIDFPKNNNGKFAFDIAFKDNALRAAASKSSGTFYIDSTPPVVKIPNVNNNSAYDGDIAPEITYSDLNFDGTACNYKLLRYDIGKPKPEEITSFTVYSVDGENPNRTVTYENFAKSFKVDGIYRLEAEMTDLAGNVNKESKLFSVNRFGSTFMIDDEATQKLVNENRYTNTVEDVKVKEINVNKIEESSVSINYNETTRQLKWGEDYETTESGGTGTEWYVCEYKMKKDNYNAEGNYVTIISSVDHFKNKITNRNAYVQPDDEVDEGDEPENRTCPVEFVVDKTKPLISISGVSENEYYEEPEREVTVICDDANITLNNFGIVLDGKTLTADKDYTAREINDSIEAKLVLDSDATTEDRTLAVTAFDKANNSETWEVKGFRLNASWFARFLHYNFPLFIIILAAIALAIGAAVFLIIRKRKKGNA